jgi:hypothetical protein
MKRSNLKAARIRERAALPSVSRVRALRVIRHNVNLSERRASSSSRAAPVGVSAFVGAY